MKYYLNLEHECVKAAEDKPQPIITHEKIRGEVIAEWVEITKEKYEKWCNYIWKSWGLI